MTRGWRIGLWLAGVVVGVALVVLGVLLFRAGLDDADKWASVIGVFVAVIGLCVSVYGVLQSRRAASAQGEGIVASGSGTIAAQVIVGGATTGSRSPVYAPQGDSGVSAPAAGPLRIEASGDRSIAGQIISDGVSTGDDSPINPR